MDLVDDRTHRALAYVAALNGQGYSPTATEFDAYVNAPESWKVGTLLATVELSIAFDRGAPIREYLEKVQWVESTAGQLGITEVGKNLLSHLEESRGLGPDYVEIVLDPEDPFVLSRAIGRLAEAGNALLVDAYFRLDMLGDIVEHTKIERILMTDAVKEVDRRALHHALSKLASDRSVEVRVAPHEAIHDRYVIPRTGPITFIGASLNTIGRKPTFIGKIRDAADEIRKQCEGSWKKAKALEPVPSNDDSVKEPSRR